MMFLLVGKISNQGPGTNAGHVQITLIVSGGLPDLCAISEKRLLRSPLITKGSLRLSCPLSLKSRHQAQKSPLARWWQG
jgi:hypothetical protein